MCMEKRRERNRKIDLGYVAVEKGKKRERTSEREVAKQLTLLKNKGMERKKRRFPLARMRGNRWID